MNKKTFYEAPEAEILAVKFEGNFCATGDGTWDGSINPGTSWNGDAPQNYGLE